MESRLTMRGTARTLLLRIGPAAAICLSALVAPATARGAAPVFGVPTIRSTFQVGIDLSEPVTLPDGVKRVETLVQIGPGALYVTEIDVPPAGGSTLSYRLETPQGRVIPNTQVSMRFRLTLADGSQAVGPAASLRYEDTRFDWHTLKGTIVRVHWAQGSDAFGRRALTIGEDAVAKVSQLLGVTETQPIDFYIYPDSQSFYAVLSPSTNPNVGGIAFIDIRTLMADISPGSIDAAWVGIVVPHELTHMVFGTAIDNPYHGPPRWLNEGLAVYESQGYDSGSRAQVQGAVDDGSLLPLTGLGGLFPTSGTLFSLAYAESVSSIDFLVRTYGRDALVRLIKSYHQGLTDDEAFSAALGVNVAGFQARWLAALGAATPKALGPQPAPAGPLPPGWDAAPPTPGQVVAPAPSSTGPIASITPATPLPAASPGDSPGAATSIVVDAGVVLALVVVIVGIILVAVLIRRRRAPR